MFDGRQFYAAKTVSDGTHRYLVGWQSVKRDCDDAAKCIWGGTLLAHELMQKENGELEVKPLETVVNAYSEKVELIPHGEQGEWKIDSIITGEEQQGFGWCELGELKPECMFETDVIWEKEPDMLALCFIPKTEIFQSGANSGWNVAEIEW